MSRGSQEYHISHTTIALRPDRWYSQLVYGINCGTSDETSGLSHNRCVGWVADRIIEAGGRVVGAETTGAWSRMEETTELNVSDMFDGTTLDQAGERLLNEVLDICEGKMTKGEALREWNAFAITRCGPSV